MRHVFILLFGYHFRLNRRCWFRKHIGNFVRGGLSGSTARALGGKKIYEGGLGFSLHIFVTLYANNELYCATVCDQSVRRAVYR